MFCRVGLSFSSTCMYFEINIALIIRATNKEEPNTTERVIGKNIRKLPSTPGHKPNGKKAASVVAVEAIIGQATSPIPCFTASILGKIGRASCRDRAEWARGGEKTNEKRKGL